MGPKEKTTLVVLAGGKSSRMGKDKRYLSSGGITFMERLELLAGELSLPIVFSGVVPNKNGIRDLGRLEGPLDGVFSVLEACPIGTLLVFVPVDMPFLKSIHFLKLFSEWKDGDVGIAFEQFRFPFLISNPSAEIRSQWLSRFAIDKRNASIKEFQKNAGFREVKVPLEFHQALNFNVNTLKDWNDWLAMESLDLKLPHFHNQKN